MFRDYLKFYLDYEKDQNGLTFIALSKLKREIQLDLNASFEMAQPIIDKNQDLYNSSTSFVDFLFQLLKVEPKIKSTENNFPCESKQNFVSTLDSDDRIENILRDLNKTNQELDGKVVSFTTKSDTLFDNLTKIEDSIQKIENNLKKIESIASTPNSKMIQEITNYIKDTFHDLNISDSINDIKTSIQNFISKVSSDTIKSCESNANLQIISTPIKDLEKLIRDHTEKIQALTYKSSSSTNSTDLVLCDSKPDLQEIQTFINGLKTSIEIHTTAIKALTEKDYTSTWLEPYNETKKSVETIKNLIQTLQGLTNFKESIEFHTTAIKALTEKDFNSTSIVPYDETRKSIETIKKSIKTLEELQVEKLNEKNLKILENSITNMEKKYISYIQQMDNYYEQKFAEINNYYQQNFTGINEHYKSLTSNTMEQLNQKELMLKNFLKNFMENFNENYKSLTNPQTIPLIMSNGEEIIQFKEEMHEDEKMALTYPTRPMIEPIKDDSEELKDQISSLQKDNGFLQNENLKKDETIEDRNYQISILKDRYNTLTLELNGEKNNFHDEIKKLNEQLNKERNNFHDEIKKLNEQINEQSQNLELLLKEKENIQSLFNNTLVQKENDIKNLNSKIENLNGNLNYLNSLMKNQSTEREIALIEQVKECNGEISEKNNKIQSLEQTEMDLKEKIIQVYTNINTLLKHDYFKFNLDSVDQFDKIYNNFEELKGLIFGHENEIKSLKEKLALFESTIDEKNVIIENYEQQLNNFHQGFKSELEALKEKEALTDNILSELKSKFLEIYDNIEDDNTWYKIIVDRANEEKYLNHELKTILLRMYTSFNLKLDDDSIYKLNLDSYDQMDQIDKYIDELKKNKSDMEIKSNNLEKERDEYLEIYAKLLIEIFSKQKEDSLIETEIEEICIICNNSFRENKSIYRLRCQHFFHTECVNNIFSEKRIKCPTCSEIIIPTILEEEEEEEEEKTGVIESIKIRTKIRNDKLNKEKFKKRVDTIHDLRKINGKLNNDLEEYRKQLLLKTEQLENLKGCENQLKLKNEEYETSMNKLKECENQLKLKNEEYETFINKCEEQLKLKNEEYENCMNELKKCRDELKLKNEKYENLMNNKKEMDNKRFKRINDDGDNSDTKRSCINDIDKLNTKIRDLNTELNIKESNIKNLNAELENIKVKQVQEQHDINIRYQKSLTDQDTEFSELIEKKEEEISNLKRTIQSLQEPSEEGMEVSYSCSDESIVKKLVNLLNQLFQAHFIYLFEVYPHTKGYKNLNPFCTLADEIENEINKNLNPKDLKTYSNILLDFFKQYIHFLSGNKVETLINNYDVYDVDLHEIMNETKDFIIKIKAES